MNPLFYATAISRQDGSAADGIHLLWTAPYPAGYSVNGYDIQRREGREKPEVTCYTLTLRELEALHRDLRLDLPIARLGVRQAACPDFPKTPPDEPYQPDEARTVCVDFREVEPGEGPNPRKVKQVTFEVLGPAGNPAVNTRILTIAGFSGLDCGQQLIVRLPSPALAVELTQVHFAQPARVEAFDARGKKLTGAGMHGPRQAETLTLKAKGIDHVRVTAPQDETLLLRFCYTMSEQDPDREAEPEVGGEKIRAMMRAEATRYGTPSVFPKVESGLPGRAGAAFAAAAGVAVAVNRPPICLAYRLGLRFVHRFVVVEIGVQGTLAIALREGKAVEARVLVDPSGVQRAVFENRFVDEVLLYTGRVAGSLTICIDVPTSPDEEAREWANAPYIAKGIQLPLRSVNSSLVSAADEENLAAGRLLAGEGFDSSAFREVADLMNEVGDTAGVVSPVWLTALSRERAEDPFIDLRAWPYALSLVMNPGWRRMLGFGFLDAGSGLVSGNRYDYRIRGTFRRRDIEERLFGFHTIPSGTTLPASFHLGSLLFNTCIPVPVKVYPPAASNTLRSSGRKGIELKPIGPGGSSLSITFPAAVQAAILEFEIDLGLNLTYEARTSDYVTFLSGSVFTGPVAASRRVRIDFPEPVDTLILKGSGFFYGVRQSKSPPGADPDELLEKWVIVSGVRYEPTPAPPPPPFLGSLNLQQPVLPGDPAVTTQNPPKALGFRLVWLPPPPAGSPGPLPWPADLDSFPPFEVLGFHLERRRVDTGGPFVEVDDRKPHTLFFGNRGSRRDPPQLYPGIDLLDAFPEKEQIYPPVPVFMEAEDVLTSTSKAGPPPGSLHQYCIFSVDAIGRASASPTVGSVVRLEKRVPPPQPVAPTTPPPEGAIMPSGVRARVLQASDPDLTDADRTLLGTSTNAIVLEWGWTQQERTRDPYAAEFRVYWQPLPPDTIHVALTGAAALVGGLFEMAANLDRPVAADAMKGRYLKAGAYPFKIASHTAGQSITIRFDPAKLDSTATPVAAEDEFHPVLNGSELRPTAWPERNAVIPITAAENYQQVLRDRLTLDAAHPRARAWVGVSTADAQAYIPDEIPAGRANGGRPGNESSIAAVPAQARYIGRPAFSVPPPLADVPEQVTDEPNGETVAVSLNLPALMTGVTIPPGHKILVERLPVDSLVAIVGANTDNTIRASLPDSSTQNYTLGNPADQAAFLAEIRSRVPASVEGKFLMDLFLRFRAQLEVLWQPALPQPVSFGVVTDQLPNKAERYLHRFRLVDPAGHTSQGAAILPQLVRVPSLRSPAPPGIEVVGGNGNGVTVKARLRDGFDLRWLLLFSYSAEISTKTEPFLLSKPQLLRLPNRRDLYPGDGIRLRLGDGTLLSPTAVDVSTGTLQVPDRLLETSLSPGFDRRVTVWAAALTRDGIPSRLTEQSSAITGPTPLTVPALSVTAAAGEDQATWGALTTPAEISLERSTDGAATWRRVSLWLPETATGYNLPGVSGARQYRLVLRGRRGQTATGAAVSLP